MLPTHLQDPGQRSSLGWLLLRLTLAGLIAAHGWARWWVGGVVPFGGFLESQGLPAGNVIAGAITDIEIVRSLLLAAGRFVAPLAAVFAAIYATRIALVHAKVGWFVAGLGRNGSEYSMLLIVCLLVVGLQHVGKRQCTPANNAAFPPAAAVFTVSVCSAVKR